MFHEMIMSSIYFAHVGYTIYYLSKLVAMIFKYSDVQKFLLKIPTSALVFDCFILLFVISRDLSHNNLTGPIPDFLGQLPSLSFL